MFENSRKLSGAIVGFGEVARHGHWPAYARSRDAAIVAVVDRTAERRALAASLLPSVATFATLDDLAASALAIDFVDICTPPSLHPQPMLDAVARGWHVLCEKPFVLDPEVLDTVRSRAEAAGVALVPVHNWKYAPIIQRASSVLAAGAIGTLRRVEIETTRAREASSADPARPNWRRDPAIAGGGILMDHGWHAIYLARHWFGESPASVRAALHYPSGDRAGGVEDEARVTIGFASGDAVMSLTWNGTGRRNALRLIGGRGEIEVDDDVLRVRGALSETATFDRPLSAGSHHDDWFSSMLPDIVAIFRQPAKATAGLTEAADCLSVIRQAYRASESVAR